MTTDCGHGFENPKHCATCMYEGNIPPSTVTLNEHPFRARKSGDCAICDQPIHPGDLIFGRSDDTYIHYRHAPSNRRN